MVTPLGGIRWRDYLARRDHVSPRPLFWNRAQDPTLEDIWFGMVYGLTSG